jgi:peptidoglycan/LPS O-acetylase OafA/YrhL
LTLGTLSLTTTTRFFTPLEALRGIAALCVVVYHASWTNAITQCQFFQNSALMVDFFFVLSGFVICHSYAHRLATGTDARRFLWLRLGRLYPLHLAFLLVFAALKLSGFLLQTGLSVTAGFAAFAAKNGWAFVCNVFLLHSLGFLHSLSFNYPSWSISTEYFTYVLFAIVCLLLGHGLRLVAASLAIIAGSAALLWNLGIHALVDATVSWGFIRCVGGFFLGVMVWWLCLERPSGGALSAPPTGSASRLALPTVLLIAAAFLSTVSAEGRATYFFPLLSGLVIIAAVRTPDSVAHRILITRPLRWLGQISYSLYMTHASVQWVMSALLSSVFHRPKVLFAGEQIFVLPPSAGIGTLIVYVVIVLALSTATFKFIEEPFRIRSRQLADQIWPQLSLNRRSGPSADGYYEAHKPS